MDTYLKPFWSEKGKYKGKLITNITSADITAWQVWRDENFPHLAPSTLNKQNTTLRHLFKLAVRQGESFPIPEIVEATPYIEDRGRPLITLEQMEKVEDYLTKRYKPAFREGVVDRRSAYPFLLKNYLDLLKFSGIRPWMNKGTALRMKDIVRTRQEGQPTINTIHRREKGKEPYEAIVSRRFIKTFDAVNRFYKRVGIGEDREYFFVHPLTIGDQIKKGNPILSFKKQWATMMRHFGWNEDVKEGSYKRLTFYSYRHAFITNKLENKKLSIWQISQSTNTSIAMIEKIYGHFISLRQAEELLEDDYDYLDTATIFSPDGLEVDEVETNSKAHWDWWNKSPDQVAFPPEE